jgi:hypothetical protein
MRMLVLLAAVAAVASGQTGPDILKKAAETYQSLKSYQFEAQIVTESVSAEGFVRLAPPGGTIPGSDPTGLPTLLLQLVARSLQIHDSTGSVLNPSRLCTA